MKHLFALTLSAAILVSVFTFSAIVQAQDIDTADEAKAATAAEVSSVAESNKTVVVAEESSVSEAVSSEPAEIKEETSQAASSAALLSSEPKDTAVSSAVASSVGMVDYEASEEFKKLQAELSQYSERDLSRENVFVYFNDEIASSGKIFTTADFPELELTDVCTGNDGNGGTYAMIYLKNKGIDEIIKAKLILEQRDDVDYVDFGWLCYPALN